jgi:hypothetical protein
MGNDSILHLGSPGKSKESERLPISVEAGVLTVEDLPSDSSVLEEQSRQRGIEEGVVERINFVE